MNPYESAAQSAKFNRPATAAGPAAHRCFNAWIEARPAGIGMTEGATQ